MISEIAYQLIKDLSTKLSFTDKWAGLVVPMRKMVDKKEKILPVIVQAHTDCDYSDYMDLVPDSTKGSIMYAEKIGDIELTQIRPNYFMANANLRIVVWYNLNRITAGVFVDEGVIASNVLSHIPRSLSNSLFDYVKSVNIFPSGVVTGAEIFSKYTYDEVRTQFVTFPFGAVAVDVNIQYLINKCALTLIPSEVCGEPEIIPTGMWGKLTVNKIIEGDSENTDYFHIVLTGEGEVDPFTDEYDISQFEPVVFSSIPLGTYILTETTVDGYYELEPITITLTAENNDQEITITNIAE